MTQFPTNVPMLQATTHFPRGKLYCRPLSPRCRVFSFLDIALMTAGGFLASHQSVAASPAHKHWEQPQIPTNLWPKDVWLWNTLCSPCLATAGDKCVCMIVIHSWSNRLERTEWLLHPLPMPRGIEEPNIQEQTGIRMLRQNEWSINLIF